MSIIKSIKSIAPNPPPIFIDPALYRLQMSDMFLAGGQGPLNQFTYTDNDSAVKAYVNCPPLTSVINKKAQAYVNGRTWIADTKNDEATSPYSDKLRKLLMKPNPIQSWEQFEAQNYIYTQLFGFCIVLPIIPAGFKEVIDATSLWNIPSSMVKITETSKLFYQTDLSGIISKITLTYKGNETVLELKNTYIFRDFTPSFSTMVFPESRTRSLEMPINNIMAALESRSVLINYRGALGIISSDSDKSGYIPIKEDAKESLQGDFRRYGLKGQQWKFIITSAAVKWQQIGIPTRDLMLFEEIEDDIYMICDGYNYPADLMAGAQKRTYQNANEAKKGLYQETIIPESIHIYGDWNTFFKTDENKCKLKKDYGHIAILQEQKIDTGRGRLAMNQALLIEWQNNLITANQWLEMNEMDELPDGDKFYYEWVTLGKTAAPVALIPPGTQPVPIDTIPPPPQ